MKIAHVVALVSKGGEFGGPVAVAVAQAQELAKRGHTVELLAAWDGLATLAIPGVKVRLFRSFRLPGSPLTTVISPALMSFLRRSAFTYDVVHIHLGRDLVTAPASRMIASRGVRPVIQTHGMIMPDRRMKSRIIDALMTNYVFDHSTVLLALTPIEADGLQKVLRSTSKARIARIANGVPRIHAEELSIVEAPLIPEVLFLARLHPRKRVMAFAEAARSLILSGTRATFHIVGPDEGDLHSLLEFIRAHSMNRSLHYEGSIPAGAAPARIARASVFVLPSFGEVFPMTVLEALSVGTPVVLTDQCGIAPELVLRDAAIVTNGSVEQLEQAILQLLDDPNRAKEVSAHGYAALDAAFGIWSVADTLETHYQEHSAE
jgi:glycosyltransferase involved in cell wall biosynthesis